MPEFDSPPTVRSRNDLIEIMQVVMQVGLLMLRSGTVSFRVEQAMHRVALALGVEKIDVYVTLMGIIASVHSGNQHYTQIARNYAIHANLDCLSRVELLSQTISPGAQPAVIAAQLRQIQQTGAVYPQWLVVLTVALACGAFAMIQGGGWMEAIAATLSASGGQAVRMQLQKIRLNAIAVTVVGAAIATLLCQFAIQLMLKLQLVLPLPQAAFLSSVLFLVPGVLLVTAALDLVRFDLISGSLRLLYALLLLGAVAVGILLSMTLTDFTIL